MIRLFPLVALLSGLWFAAAASDITPASAAAETEEWSGAARQPCNSALHRSRPLLRSVFVVGGPAVLPAPLLLERPPLCGALSIESGVRLPPRCLRHSLGARAPPV